MNTEKTNQINNSLEGFKINSKTEDTKYFYLKRVEQLKKRASKELNVSIENLDVRQLSIWLVEKKNNIMRATWRQYKSSLIYYLENFEDKQAAIEALEYIEPITSEGSLKENSYKTSNLKLKKITSKDWETLENYLKNKNLKWHKFLLAWLRAGIITGLRPVEWKFAKLIENEDGFSLKVQNAKNTNGRAHGLERTLLLKNIDPEDLELIKLHLNNVRKFVAMDEYEFFYQGCSLSLYKACRKCWPRRKKHITLYSTRHQFSANAKSSGFNKVEIAAMMGHAVDITASMHYGRKNAGNEESKIIPDPEDIEKIKIVKLPFFEKLKKSTSTDSETPIN